MTVVSTLLALALASPITVEVETPADSLNPGEESEIHVVLSVEAPWYIYAPTGINKAQGMIETTVTMRRSDSVQFKPAVFPEAIAYGDFEVYLDETTLTLPIRIRPSALPGEVRILGSVEYQLCKVDLCLPPERAPLRVTLTVDKVRRPTRT